MVLSLAGHYQVRDYTCGYASTLTVLRYYQRYVPERDLYKRLGTNRGGTRQTAIVRELRREGIRVGVRYNLSFDDVARSIDSGRLIIGYHHRLEHWLVLNGYSRERRMLYVVDSLRNHRADHDWEEYGPKLRGFGIVCSTRKRRLSRPAINRHAASSRQLMLPLAAAS